MQQFDVPIHPAGVLKRREKLLRTYYIHKNPKRFDSRYGALAWNLIASPFRRPAKQVVFGKRRIYLA